jgi:hypothetical protein
MKAISRNVDRWDDVIGATKFVRDASFGAVVIGGVVVSGGTGLALVAGGSVGKGFGKGQDVYYESRVKGSSRLGAAIGSGTIEATMSLATAYIPGGGPAAQQGVVLFLDVSKSGAQALIEGKNFQQALADMGWSVAGFGVGKVLGNNAVQKKLGRMAFPLFWKLDDAAERGMKTTLKLARDQTTELTKAGLVTTAKALTNTSEDRTGQPLKHSPLAGEESLLDKILNRAIVQIGSVGY